MRDRTRVGLSKSQIRQRIQQTENQKRRYRDDPAYRQACKDAVTRHNQRRKKERRLDDNTPWPIEYCLTIGAVANACNRKPQTIRDFHLRGTIPPPLVDSRGRRYYTRHQRDLIRRVFALFDAGQINQKTRKYLLKQEWNDD